jgi:hypothetical protein
LVWLLVISSHIAGFNWPLDRKGDAKLAAVIVFCIGIYGMLQSIAVMSLAIVTILAL